MSYLFLFSVELTEKKNDKSWYMTQTSLSRTDLTIYPCRLMLLLQDLRSPDLDEPEALHGWGLETTKKDQMVWDSTVWVKGLL
jgi:hypothetical protein